MATAAHAADCEARAAFRLMQCSDIVAGRAVVHVHAPGERRAHVRREDLRVIVVVELGDDALGEQHCQVELAPTQVRCHRTGAARVLLPLDLQ